MFYQLLELLYTHFALKIATNMAGFCSKLFHILAKKRVIYGPELNLQNRIFSPVSFRKQKNNFLLNLQHS